MVMGTIPQGDRLHFLSASEVLYNILHVFSSQKWKSSAIYVRPYEYTLSRV
jgi:hypothetical protein